MRGLSIGILTVFAACGQVVAQQAGSSNSAPAISLDFVRDSTSLFTPPPDENVISGKHFQITGPLVAPLKSKKLWDVPVRLLQLINPFQKPSGLEQPKGFREVDSMAWTTMADWKGRSPFPDDTHHEAQLRLLTVSLSKSH
jgi:hypothetical protein